MIYAISWRNNRMPKRSDYAVTYITHTRGGAYQYAEKAKRQKKNVIGLTKMLFPTIMGSLWMKIVV